MNKTGVLRLLVWLASCCPFSVTSQMYHFRTYGEDEGLPHSYIYCISQSADGSLCMSTGEGLSFFDGNKFTTFTTPEIEGDLVTTHFIDSRKNYWVGHLQNGVSYLKNGVFNKLKNQAIEKAKVTGFLEDAHHNVWISTLGGGLFVADSMFKLRSIRGPAENIYAMLFGADGHLLIAAANGLFLLDVSGTNTAKVVYEIKEFSDKPIKQLVAADTSRTLFWAGVEGEGLYGIRREGNSFRVFLHLQQELQSEKSTVDCMYTDQSGGLWLSFFGEGLRKIVFSGSPEEGNYSVFKIDGSNGLKNLYVQTIFEDFEGNMWFGTFGGGLIEKPVEKFSFYGTAEGVEYPDVKKIAMDKKGNIWMGNKAGLAFFDPKSHIGIQYSSSNGFEGGEVRALHFDTKGLLWIGTTSKGIYRFDRETGRFENFSSRFGITPLSIHAIIESRGEIVIATDDGIVIFDQQSAQVQYYTTSHGLLHNNLIHVFYDSKRRLWVSSHGSPPYYIQGGKVKVLKDIQGLSYFNINAVTEDRKGIIWIATEGDGVFSYDGDSCINYRMKQGLASNYCYGIETDRNNSVWVSHKNGISEKKEGEQEFHPLVKASGLLFVENNLNAMARDAAGDLWFGTTEGIVHYNSETGKKHVVEPRLSILGMKLNDTWFGPEAEIRVPFGYYSAHIKFLAISLTNPENISYKYRLLGIDSAWKYTNQRFVDYPNLGDGDYAFEVHACNSERLWTHTPARISFSIREPVWKKAWFYILLALTLITIIYVIIIWRTQNLKRSQRLLRIKVKQKTLLLQREKEAVEKIKTELEHKNKDILDSITYARRIQDSLLPPDETLRELFDENYFILYRPKDIVSGDFYWAARVETGGERSRTLSLAAVADCTGHGVPGAFLSIVASSFLKQSLTEKFVNNPGDVLDYLNKSIAATLNQSSKSRNRINDGMDLAIIAVDYKDNRLHYAGANNPIYIFRKAENDTQVFTLKPTKQAIGSASEAARRYESQVFDLQAGDTIYMFSDGYADQFGGEKDKKFNYRRFRDVLRVASEMPVSLQRAYIEQCFEEWKGLGEQTDDVCVMGLKI
jgi:ligand-binding sensor domain-containing protein/serine phosphatase RsbU (regulator of sigma subunit)